MLSIITRQPPVQLGKALSVIVLAEAYEDISHAEISAFYAPSECHELVRRGEDKRRRQARRLARSIARGDAIRLARRAIGGRAVHRACDRALANVIARLSPFG